MQERGYPFWVMMATTRAQRLGPSPVVRSYAAWSIGTSLSLVVFLAAGMWPRDTDSMMIAGMASTGFACGMALMSTSLRLVTQPYETTRRSEAEQNPIHPSILKMAGLPDKVWVVLLVWLLGYPLWLALSALIG